MSETRLQVRVQARASGDALTRRDDGLLLARVTAPPVDGRANRAVSHLIARALGIASSRVTVVRGERSRDKVLAVAGMSATAVDRALRSSL